jgi:hypothetical protein
MKGIFTNRSFIITFITNSLYFGTLKGLLIVIPYLMEPFEFKETDYANAGKIKKKYNLILLLLLLLLFKRNDGNYRWFDFIYIY